MARQYTLDDLHRMHWQEFEKTAVDVVRRLYSKYGIEISKTPYSHDDGRDGEAQHIVAIGLGSDLAITIKIFLEIKQRKNENVGKSDIGSHVIDAFANKVTKVIFITNREFTEPLCKWLQEFCGPLNIQFSLISGTRLVEWLNAPEEFTLQEVRLDSPHNFSGTSVEVFSRAIHGRLTYTLDPNEAIGGITPCNARTDRPVFAIIDLTVGEELTLFHSLVDLVPKQMGAAAVYRIGDRKAPVIFSPGDRQRWIFAIWPQRPGKWDDSCFDLVLGEADVPLIVRSTNAVYVPEPGLSVALAGSQLMTEASLRRGLENWLATGGIAMRFLISPGGLGKSFIVGRLRREWQANGSREVVLDGETAGNDIKLIERTFSTLFPFPKVPFDNGAKPALMRWLKGLNLSLESCETLAADLCQPNGLRLGDYGISLRAQMLAALLAETSSASGLVFVLEDLHKVSPSVLSILEQGLSLLRSWGRGNIFILLTSRPAREAGTQDITSAWLERLRELSALAEDSIDILAAPSAQDAREMLCQTVPTLESVHVQQIIQQVGTAPFNLREAVLYLCQLGVLQTLEAGGRLVLGEPTKLDSLLAHDGLDRITRRRLEVFFRDKPVWLRKLIEAGACYGRQFPFLLVGHAIHMPDWDEAVEAIADCARWSFIALSPDRRENLEFDHDLVRNAVLALMPDLRHRELAGTLLTVLEGSDETVRMAELAYQAGYAERAFDLARMAARQQNEKGRPTDSLKANYIALLTLDPEWTKFDKRNSSWVDAAVQAAPICRRKFSNWQERDRTALTVLRDNLECLGTASAGSSSLSDAILTEARMLSQRLGDDAGNASLIAMEGRLLFERDDVAGAVARHQEAEKLFALLGREKARDRAENLVRLAICLRQMGRRDDSLKILRQALKHRIRSDWTLLNKVRSNTGAAYLLSDWDKVRYHWERQLRSAEAHALLPRKAHALASLSFINLFDGRSPEGRRQAEEALEIARAQGFDNTRLRCDLHLSAACLMEGNPEAALHYLNEAESIAIQHQIGRRLWRVYANLASAHELNGQVEKARARDLQTVTSLGAQFWKSEGLLKRGRHLLPLMNIAFRSYLNPATYEPILLRLQPENVRVVREIASLLINDKPCPLDSIILKYLVDVGGCRRFLLTE